jgi:MarR family transcriptional regulator, organic hydroperoxide resistance regulator
MVREQLPDKAALAEALLDIVPGLLRRVGADVPLEGTGTGAESVQGWRDVAELRATPGQLSLLGILVEHGRCTMQELAEHLAVTPPTATAMVKRLLAQGYVERAHDESDWRTVWVKPTESGCRAVTVFQQARLASLESRLDHLSDEERASILAALPALRHLIEV